MDSTQKKIMEIVKAGGEGKVYFPSDFFEPILPKQKDPNSSSKNSTRGPKSIYVSLQKEYDEDKELLDLLSSKRNL